MFNKEGYTLIDILLSVFIISTLSLIYLSFKPFEIKYYHQFIYDYWFKQTESLINVRNEEVNDENCFVPYPIYFNEKGNVNQAQTIECYGKEMVVELGFGRLVER